MSHIGQPTTSFATQRWDVERGARGHSEASGVVMGASGHVHPREQQHHPSACATLASGLQRRSPRPSLTTRTYMQSASGESVPMPASSCLASSVNSRRGALTGVSEDRSTVGFSTGGGDRQTMQRGRSAAMDVTKRSANEDGTMSHQRP